MNIFDKIRIKRKIRKICKVLRKLPEEKQAVCLQRIVSCLRVTDNWMSKEHYLDMLIERLGVICR